MSEHLEGYKDTLESRTVWFAVVNGALGVLLSLGIIDPSEAEGLLSAASVVVVAGSSIAATLATIWARRKATKKILAS